MKKLLLLSLTFISVLLMSCEESEPLQVEPPSLFLGSWQLEYISYELNSGETGQYEAAPNTFSFYESGMTTINLDGEDYYGSYVKQQDTVVVQMLEDLSYSEVSKKFYIESLSSTSMVTVSLRNLNRSYHFTRIK